LPVAHGEGNFYIDESRLNEIQDQVFLQYTNESGEITMDYPQNPNGSMQAIAGITDSTGRIVGMMPHPERFIYRHQHPNWRREDLGKPDGLVFFEDLLKKVD
jgi:phosphoribosylformylglycinamidine synthase